MNILALEGVVAITAILIIFYGPWQDFCVDVFRQYAFQQRDKIFDLAADGVVDFTSDEYRSARSNLEAIIRFAHKATFARVMFIWIFSRDIAKAATGSIVPEPYSRYVRKVRIALIAAMLIRSGPVVLLFIIIVPFAVMLAIYIFIAKRSFRGGAEQAKRVERIMRKLRIFDYFVQRVEIESLRM